MVLRCELALLRLPHGSSQPAGPPAVDVLLQVSYGPLHHHKCEQIMTEVPSNFPEVRALWMSSMMVPSAAAARRLVCKILPASSAVVVDRRQDVLVHEVGDEEDRSRKD